MPLWIGPAVGLLAGAGLLAGRVAGRLFGGRGARTALAVAGGAALGAGGLGIPGVDLFPEEEEKKRRRRRRALSQGDRDDISFIAATISSVAAGKFAVMLATRAR